MKIIKHKLFIIAGILWCFAGTMVTKTGLNALKEYRSFWVFPAAALIYVVFYTKIFAPLVVKHDGRISGHPDEKLPWYMFFDKKSYIIMICMMTFGTLLRKSGFIPTWFFSFFYTGLGLALFSCGVRFIYIFFKCHKEHTLIENTSDLEKEQEASKQD